MEGVAGAVGVHGRDRSRLPALQARAVVPGREDPAALPAGHAEHAARAAPQLGDGLLRRVTRLLQHVLLGRDDVVGAVHQAPRPRPPGAGVEDRGDPAPLALVERGGRQGLIGRVQQRDVGALEELRQPLERARVRHRLRQPDDGPRRVRPRDDDRGVLRRLVVGDPRALHALGVQLLPAGTRRARRRRTSPGAGSRLRAASRRSRPGRPTPRARCGTRARGSPSRPGGGARGRRDSPPSPSRSRRPSAAC